MAPSLTKSCRLSAMPEGTLQSASSTIAPNWLRRSRACGLLIIGLCSATPVAAQEHTVAASNSLAPAANLNRSILKLGSQGEEVSELQATLKLLGYYTGKVDGVYAENTAQAVAKFQATAGLSADGIAGRETWNRLFPSTPAPTAATPADPASAIAKIRQTSPKIGTAPTATVPKPEATTEPPSLVSLNSQMSQVDFPVLKLGMRGTAVTGLQQRLRANGFFQGSVDGVFGPQTHEAVKAAQQQFQLNTDGVVGPATWQVLLTK